MDSTEDQPPEDEPHSPRSRGQGRSRQPPSGPLLTPDFDLREIRTGRRPGSRYVRVTRRSKRPLRRLREGHYETTPMAIRPRSWPEGIWRILRRIVVGAPLPTSRLMDERLSKLKALAVFSSNNLSSSAYATEEILLILVLAGTGVFSASIPIAIAIAALVVIVAVSYSQVIRGYPNGGGSYVVAKENLGTFPGLVAGSSLMVDYTLTVAVSTAAGAAAVISAVPELHDQRIALAVGFVVLLTLANLRGVRESGTILAAPTYFFVVSFTVLIVTGLVRVALGHDLEADTPPDIIEPGTRTLGLFLILRAFSSGSAALTGIEAVSNGVPSFEPPESKNANITLAWMAGILSFFFLGLTVLAHEAGVTPSETRTIVAQVAESVFGKTVLFYVVQGATTLILILAANTSFAGLPTLASVMARDRTLPRQFSFRGDRLAFSNGIIVLGIASILLLVVFQAKTHALIPLYAVGVFVGFTLAQTGLTLRWHREGSPGARTRMLVNAAGAAATGVVAVIITVTKFVDGAWITVGAIAVLTFLFARIHAHYRYVARQLEVTAAPPAVPPADQRSVRSSAVVVPVDEVNRAVMRALDYAHTISSNVTAVHLTDEAEAGEALRKQWEKTIPNTPVVVIESPYRSYVGPMLTYIDALDRTDPGAPITVVLPEFVPTHFWEGLLHNQSSLRLKRALIHRPNTVIIGVPYQLRP